MRIKAAFAIRINIKLNLPDTAIELLRQRLMLVVKTLVSIRILRLPDLALIRRNPGVITVVRANDLNLIQLQCSVGSLSQDSGVMAGQNRDQGDGGRNAEAAQVQGNIL